MHQGDPQVVSSHRYRDILKNEILSKTAFLFSALPEGVVFDSGDGVSHSVPVFDGHCLPHAVQRFPLAGRDVTLHLIQVFVKSQPSVYRPINMS